MKVVNKNIRKEVPFRDITKGEVFLFSGLAYMKVDGQAELKQKWSKNNNAILLTYGNYASFGFHELVEKVERQPTLILE